MYMARRNKNAACIWTMVVINKPFEGLFGLEGIEGVWKVFGGIKSPTTQNFPQSSPIPPNPLTEGINRTRSKGSHLFKSLIQQLRMQVGA